jgi:lactam utilization protein B
MTEGWKEENVYDGGGQEELIVDTVKLVDREMTTTITTIEIAIRQGTVLLCGDEEAAVLLLSRRVSE